MQEATDERERNEGIFFCLISKTALLVLSRHYLDHCTCTKYVTVNLRCYVLVQVSKWAMALISSLILQVGFHPWDDLLDLRQCHIMQDSTYSQRGCLHLWTESLKHLDLLLYWDLVGDGGLDVQYRLHWLKSFSSWKILIEGTWLLIISVSVSSCYLYRCIWTFDWRQPCSWRTVSACISMKRMMKSKTQNCNTLSRLSPKTEEFRGPVNSLFKEQRHQYPVPYPLNDTNSAFTAQYSYFFSFSDGWRLWNLTWVSESTI